MSISNAMQAAVAGLSSNAKAVGKVSENIANSGTVGYKRNFASMVSTSGADGGGGVRAELRQNVSTAGQVTTTSSATDLAISGSGFFVVSKFPNDPNEGNYMLTRAGSFVPDENGYLKNSAGFYLAAYPTDEDGSIGAVDFTSFNSMSTVRVGGVEMTAQATSGGTITGNLPSDETGTGVATAPFISTMQYFNPLGGSEGLNFSWQADAANPNTWSVTVRGADGVTYGSIDVEFNDSGATPGAPMSYTGTQDAGLAAPATFAVSAAGQITMTINNGDTPQSITLELGAPGTYDGVTQFAGDYTPQTFKVDGEGVTQLEDYEFDDEGSLWGVFANGQRKSLYRVALADVPNPDGLRAVDGNAYKVGRDSGAMALNLAGTGGMGIIRDFTLEGSNVDVAQEMTDLIQLQRAYSSNAKVVTTADEMLQETTNLKR